MNIKDKYTAFDLKIENENDKEIYRVYGHKKVSLEEARVLLANNINRTRPNPLLELVAEFDSMDEVNAFFKTNNMN